MAKVGRAVKSIAGMAIRAAAAAATAVVMDKVTDAVAEHVSEMAKAELETPKHKRVTSNKKASLRPKVVSKGRGPRPTRRRKPRSA